MLTPKAHAGGINHGGALVGVHGPSIVMEPNEHVTRTSQHLPVLHVGKAKHIPAIPETRRDARLRTANLCEFIPRPEGRLAGLTNLFRVTQHHDCPIRMDGQ